MNNRVGSAEIIGEILAKSQPGRLTASTKKEKVCSTCGEIFTTWSDGDICRKCQGKLYIANEIKEMESKLPEMNIEGRDKWYSQSGIPVTFLEKTFANFDKKLQPKAFKYLSEYDPETKKSIVMSSPAVYGVGKTHLVCALINKLLEAGEPVGMYNRSYVYRICPAGFFSENQLLRRIRQTYNRANSQRGDYGYEETEDDVYTELSHVPLLIVDDVGKVRPRDLSFLQGVYFNIIDQRYSDGQPIILTTNLDFKELEVFIGGACADRLFEMCGKDGLIKMDGKSYRIKN